MGTRVTASAFEPPPAFTNFPGAPLGCEGCSNPTVPTAQNAPTGEVNTSAKNKG